MYKNIERKQLLSFFLLMIFFPGVRFLPFEGLRQMLIVVIPASCFIYFFSYESKIVEIIRKNKVIKAISNEAIGIFLLHYILLEIVGKYYKSGNPIIATFAVLVVSLLLSFGISHINVEVNVKRIIRKI